MSVDLKELSGFVGTWVNVDPKFGTGWNIIAFPSPGSIPDNTGDFALLFNQLQETFTFEGSSAQGTAPNRGGNVTQTPSFVQYNKKVTDFNVGGTLHEENGMFLQLADSEAVPGGGNPGVEYDPKFPYARMSIVPHGNSLMMPGSVFNTGPEGFPFPTVSMLPQNVGTAPLGYTDPYFTAKIQGTDRVAAEEFPPTNAAQPLKITLEQYAEQAGGIKSTTTLAFSTKNAGGVDNIPFGNERAKTVRMDSIFWLTDFNKDVSPLFQYIEMINIEFHDNFDGHGKIIWPHVTTNSMVFK